MTDVIKLAVKNAQKIENSKYFEMFQYSLYSPKEAYGNKGFIFAIQGLEDIVLKGDIYLFPEKVDDIPIPAYGFLLGNDFEKPQIYLNEALFTNFGDKYNYSVNGTLLHEILHYRLAHISRFREFYDKNPMLTNFVLDLFIQEIVGKIVPEPDQLKNSTISFETLENKKDIISLGIKVSKKYFNVEDLKSKDEFELLSFFFEKFQEVFNVIDKMIDNQIQNYFSQNPNKEIESIEDVLQIAKKIFDLVKDDVQNHYKANKDFQVPFNDISQFGPLDNFVFEEILKRLLGGSGGGGEGNKENEDKLKEFAENVRKLKGNVGNYFRELFVKKEKVSIQKLVQNHLSRLERGGYLKHRYIYPNKALYNRTNVILGKRKYFGLELAMIIDTSGSMSENDISKALSIGIAFIENGCSLNIYFNDTDFQKFHIDSVHKLKKLLNGGKVIGGGGSVFDKVFEEVQKKEGNVILITDLYIAGLDKLPPHTLVIATENFDKENFEFVRKKGNPIYKVSEII